MGPTVEDVIRTFDGFIDDVRVYGRLLTPEEIEAVYVASQGAACP